MIHVRAAASEDRSEIADLIYASINTWYRLHGMPQIFHGGPAVTEVFCDVYELLDPGCCAVAQNASTGRLMGSCFYHPRKTHVGLGIMNVPRTISAWAWAGSCCATLSTSPTATATGRSG